MRNHNPIYRIKDAGEPDFISLTSDQYADSCREADPRELTIDAMAEMLDYDAENGNYHDFVGCHAKLAKLFSARCKPFVAKELMRDLCDVGGLHGMRE